MSREDDRGLYDTSAGSRKMSDMKNRCARVEESGADWSSASTRTATTRRTYPVRRYFITGSQRRGNGWRKYCRSASTMRWETRTAEKPNRMTAIISCSTSKCPIVIVECGFLSNWKEAALLKTEEYQDRVAYTLHMGIMEYLNGR